MTHLITLERARLDLFIACKFVSNLTKKCQVEEAFLVNLAKLCGLAAGHGGCPPPAAQQREVVFLPKIVPHSGLYTKS